MGSTYFESESQVIPDMLLLIVEVISEFHTATCKSQNEESGNGMRGILECEKSGWERGRLRVGAWGIRVGTRGIKVGTRGIRVGMRGLGVGMRGIRRGMVAHGVFTCPSPSNGVSPHFTIEPPPSVPYTYFFIRTLIKIETLIRTLPPGKQIRITTPEF